MAGTESQIPPWRAGRPTKLNEKVTDTICFAVMVGATREVAAQAAGISISTLKDWIKRGEATKSGPYHEFLAALTVAENAGQVHHLNSIKKSGAAGSMWILQRRFPQLYGDTTIIKLEVQKGLEELMLQAAEVLPPEWMDVLLVAWGAKPSDNNGEADAG